MIDFVARAFCIRDKLIEEEHETQKNNWNINKLSATEAASKNDTTELNHAKVRLLEGEGRDVDGYDQNHSNNIERLSIMRSSLSHDIHIIREILEAYRDKKAKAAQKDKYLREWRVICCITDRLFFLMYVLFNIVGIVIIFFGQGH